MFNLASASSTLKLVTGSAGTVDVHVSYIDDLLTAGAHAYTEGANDPTQITTATTTTILGAPAANTTRNIKLVTIRNASTTSSNLVTVQHFDGTNTPSVVAYTLQPGDSLIYYDVSGWQYTAASTSIPLPGRFLATTIKTSGTTFTTGHFTNTLVIRMAAAGGGGGGCTSVAADAAAGGGGGAGGYCEKTVTVSPDTTYTYALGAAGTGVSGAGGNNGGDTTLTVGATTYTAKGGSGAPVATAVATLSCYEGGAGGIVGTNGDINASGEPGAPGYVLVVATPVLASGDGGTGPFGGGGVGLQAVGAGNAGTGNGSGGGGAATGASVARTGGSGTGGIIVFSEFA